MNNGELLLMPGVPIAICSIALAIVFFAVALSASAYPGKYAYDPSIGLSGLLTTIGSAVFALPIATGSLIASTGKKAFKSLPILLVLFILLSLVLVWNDNDHTILKKFDRLSTKTTLPVYHSVAMPTFRFMQLTFDIGVCWWDYQATFRNVIIRNVASVGFECAAVDWQKFVNDTVDFIGNTINIPVDFVVNNAKQPLKVEIALDNLGDMLLDLQVMLDCMCKEMAYVFDIAIPTLANKNLAAALDRAVNTIYRLGYEIIMSLVDLFDLLFKKRSAQDLINRVPKFQNTTDTFCDMCYRLTTFIDDTVTLVCVSFVSGDVCYRYIPKMNTFLGGLLCYVGRWNGGLLDLFTHVDLIFNSEALYFENMELYLIFPALYNVSNGAQKFFHGFNDSYTNDIGDMCGGLINMTVLSVETFENFTISVLYQIYNPNSFIDFATNYNTTPIYNSYELFRSGTINLATEINMYFGDFVESIILYLESWVGFLYDTIQTMAVNSSQQIILYIQTKILPRVTILAERLHSIFVALGNFIRQFDETNSCVYHIPYYPPPDTLNTNPSGTTVCALGNIVEDLGFAWSEILIFPTSLFVQVFNDTQNSFTFADFTGIITLVKEWLQGPVKIIYENVRDDLASFLASFFGDLQCPCASGSCPAAPANISTSVRLNLAEFFMDCVDVPAIVLYYWPTIFVTAIDTGISTGNVEETLCVIMPMIVDIFGVFGRLVRSISALISCIVTNSSSINKFAWSMYNLFFDPNNPDSMRNQMCAAIQVILDFFNFIYNFITQGINYLVNIVVQEGVGVVNVLIDTLNTVMQGLLNQITTNLINGDIICFINKWIICYINRVFAVFGCFGDLSDVGIGTLKLSITGICIPAGDLLGIFGIPGFSTYCLPSVPFNIPFPNIADPIENFLTCFTNGVNAPSTCTCTSCGETAAGAVITTCVSNVPDIPFFIPEVSIDPLKRNERIQTTTERPVYGPKNIDFAVMDEYESFPHNKRDSTTISDTNSTGSSLFDVIYNDYATVICGGFKSLMDNETLDASTKADAFDNYIKCLLSTQISLPLSILVYGNSTSDWASPYTFMSLGNFAASAINYFGKVTPVISHEFGCYMKAIKDSSDGNMTELEDGSYCQSWDDYYAAHNLTSNYTLQLGIRFEAWRDKEVNYILSRNGTVTLTSLLSGFFGGLNYTYGLFFRNVTGFDQTFYQIIQESFAALSNATSGDLRKRSTVMEEGHPGILYTMFVTWTTHETSALRDVKRSGLNTTRLYNRFTEFGNRIYNWFDWYTGLFINTDDERLIANRNSIRNIHYAMTNIYKEYAYMFGYYDRKGLIQEKEEYVKNERNVPMLMSMAYVSHEYDHETDPGNAVGASRAWLRSTMLGKEKIKVKLQSSLDNHFDKRVYIPNPFENGTVCGIPVIGGGTTCLNCTILFRVLDVLTEKLFECVNMSEYNYNLLDDEFLDPFTRKVDDIFSSVNAETGGLLNRVHTVRTGANYTHVGFIQMLEKAWKGRVVDNSGAESNFSWFIDPMSAVAKFLAGSILQPFIHKVTGVLVDFEYILNNLKAFFIETSEEVAGSFYYYLTLFLDTQISLNCRELSATGIGIGNLPLTIFLVLGVLIIVSVIASKITNSLLMVLAPLWLLFPAWVFMVNYGMPPTYLPAVPMCLGDDIYKILKQNDVPCIVWNNYLPGLTQEECPTEEDDHSREFLDCSRAPYYFDNPWRYLWFSLELIAPEVNRFISETDVSIISWVRNIPGMETLIHFDFPSGGPIPDDYMTCYKIRLPNYYSAFLYFGALTTGIASLSLSTIITLFLIGGAIMYIAMLCMAFASMLAGDSKGVKNTYSDITDYVLKMASTSRGRVGAAQITGGMEPAGSNLLESNDSTTIRISKKVTKENQYKIVTKDSKSKEKAVQIIQESGEKITKYGRRLFGKRVVFRAKTKKN